MDQTIISILVGVVALIIGVVAGKIIFAKNTKQQVEEANLQAQTIIKEAELRAETIKK
ncbi:MAG: Rnase Y domain-containing protein, partial [Sediminibacterium sp.]